jgi:hypothetical protein
MTIQPLPSLDPILEGALRSFLSHPSVPGWDALIRGVPQRLRRDVARQAFRRARAHGVDPTLLFHCLLRTGPGDEVLDLVEAGAVDPTAVACAAQDAAPAIKPLWWALAAQAAQARGEVSRAELMLHRALFLNPDHPGVRVVMGRMARQRAEPRREVA